MPTLLTVNNYYYYRGGAETVFLEHNKAFAELGWNVVPFAMRHPQNLPSEWSGYFVDELEFGTEYSLSEKLARIPRVVYSLQARSQLSRLLDATRPDLCHAHNVYHHISPSIFGLLESRGVPVVLTLHDLKIACPAYNMLARDGVCERCRGGRLYNVAVHRCIKNSVSLSTLIMLEAVLHRLIGSYRRSVRSFIVPSQFYIEKLVEWGVPRSKCCHVPNFVEARRFEPRYTAGEGFLYFGRVSREKGLETLVRAISATKCSLAIAGTGPDIDHLRRLAHKLRANVTFLGFLSGAQLHDAIRSARAVVLPSEWYENAPMSVLEAYALGKPVVGANIGGIPELVKEGETGFLFRSGDVADLAAVLQRANTCPPQLIAEMGRHARLWTEAAFSLDSYRDRILGVYRQIGVATTRVSDFADAH